MKDSMIIKIRKNEDGEITEVMLQNGEILPMNHAIMMAKEHSIEGVSVFRGKNGGEFLVPDPEVMETENLKDLPKF